MLQGIIQSTPFLVTQLSHLLSHSHAIGTVEEERDEAESQLKEDEQSDKLHCCVD